MAIYSVYLKNQDTNILVEATDMEGAFDIAKAYAVKTYADGGVQNCDIFPDRLVFPENGVIAERDVF